MLLANFLEARHVFAWRNHKSTFALNQFNDHGGYLSRIDRGVQSFLEGLQFALNKLSYRESIIALVVIRERNSVNLRGEGAAAHFVSRFGCEGHPQQCPSVESAGKANNSGSPGGLTGDLHGIFNRFYARVGQHHLG